MFEILAGWLILSVAIWATSAVLPGVRVDSFGTAAIVAVVFGLLNFLFGWIFFILIGIGTLGLGFLLFFITQWIVNAIMLSITNAAVDSFKIDSFGWSLVAALLISAFASIGQWIVF